MSEEEIEKARNFVDELDKSGYKYTAYGREIYVIENVFKPMFKLQKEIEFLKSQIPPDKIFYYSEKDYISKDKIKEKIKELEKERDKYLIGNINFGLMKSNYDNKESEIKILEKLLEGE